MGDRTLPLHDVASLDLVLARDARGDGMLAPFFLEEDQLAIDSSFIREAQRAALEKHIA